jgi:hypothetical protein
MAGSAKQFVELRACGPDDPDGLRTAAVLSAYLHAEGMKAFRRMLWPRLALVATTWIVVTATTSLLSRRVMLAGLVVLGAVACWAALLEWTAANRLSALLADLPPSVGSPDA